MRAWTERGQERGQDGSAAPITERRGLITAGRRVHGVHDNVHVYLRPYVAK